MEWHHANSPRKKKFKAAPLAGKIMVSIFWDSEGLLLVVIMKRGTTINSEAYVNMMKKLYSQMRCVQPHQQMEAIIKLRWTVLPQPPYSPDLESDYHL
jgi:hypothetical protein